jgi:hypothetical protein
MVGMDFSNLVSSWKDSLEVFKKKNFVLFLLASLNTLRRSLILLLKYFWWVFIIFFATDLYFSFWGFEYAYQYGSITWFFLKAFLYFYAILAARPSIERKDMEYFVTYMQKYFLIFVVFLFCYLDPIFFLFLIFAFHYLDSKPGIKNCLYSFLTSFKIVLYHLPVFIIFGVSKFLLDGLIYLYQNVKYWGINYLFGQNDIIFFIVDQFVMIFFGLIVLLFISFVSIYYTKSKHKNFDFFFRGA